MNETTTPTTTTNDESLRTSRETIQGFGRHYGYDVGYLESLMDASLGAFKAFEAAMGIGRFQNAAPTEMLAIAKIAALRVQDCRPCTLLALKMAREAGVPEEVIRGALHGRGLTAEQRDIYDHARGVAADEERGIRA